MVDAKPLVVAVAGPTAVGKSDFAIRLAELVGGEIVSADSVQVYRGLDIGTAKPTLEARRRVPHHLIDIVDPFVESMDAHRFSMLARTIVAEIAQRGRVAIVAGGTGLYMKAALGEWTFSGPPPRWEARQAWWQWPTARLYAELQAQDPEAAAQVSPNDRPRIIRLLEGARGGKAGPSPYRLYKVFLWRPRQELYERINRRAEAQWQGGLLDEAQRLLRLPEWHPAARALGYREGRWYWRGLVTSGEGLRLYQRNTRRFAKRQLTWWRREPQDFYCRAGDALEEEACLEAVQRWRDQRVGGRET